MKERIRNLSGYQKFILIALAVMAVGFGVLYVITIRREGYAYRDGLLMQSQENGNTLWSGVVEGRNAVFTVHPDKTVEYRWGDRTYGLYILKDDPTAVPKDHKLRDSMTGIQLYCEKKLLFRGGIMKVYSENYAYYMPYTEDGKEDFELILNIKNGSAADANGNTVDTSEPSVSTILQLMYGPSLLHRGNGAFWFWGLLISLITAGSVLYDDKIFRWNMKWTVRNPEDAEPSDWYIVSRHISWTVVGLAALVIYIIGLTGVN